MSDRKITKSIVQKEYIAELLKERIYATLALLAVLISIDTDNYSPLHAAYLMFGTIFSLWAASMVATLMSRRVIFQDSLDEKRERQHQLRKHAPMLAALVFPLLMVSLSILGIMPLNIAVNIAIASSLALLVGWSILSARSLQAKRLPTIVLVVIELAIGLSVIGLKILIGH